MTARPSHSSGDPLADVLRMVRLEGAVFLDNRLTAPWCFLSAVESADCAPFNLVPRQIIAYHLIVEGSVFVTLPGEHPVQARAGDAVILPRNNPHYLSSDVTEKAVNAADYMLPATHDALGRLEFGGGGALARLYCGFLASSDKSNPVIEALPPLLTLSLRDYESYDWIESSIRFAIKELIQGRLASSDTMSRLSELMLVEAVRRFVADNAGEYSWLNGFRDPQIGRALAALHHDLSRGWAVEELAEEAGMSRSAFNARFNELLGHSPIRYLTMWRLRAAQSLLRDGAMIAQIANAVGYDSEEAFSRAFKREFGLAPGQWRGSLLRK